jgi:hypothetical protein
VSEFRDSLFEHGNTIMDWGKDEDGDDLIVFYSWAGLKTFGEAIVDALDTKGLLVEGEVVLVDGRESATTLKMSALRCDFAKIAEALNSMFDVTKFTAESVESLFDEVVEADDLPGHDAMDVLACSIHVDRFIDKAGVEMGFEDTYERCVDCCALIYTQATHYGDHGRYRHNEDGELICRDCDLKNPEKYLDEYLEDIAKKGETIRAFELPIPAGFKQISEEDTFMGETRRSPIMFERGLHRHQRENPKSQYKLLADNGITDVLFDIETGQFDVRWSLWVRDADYDAAHHLVTSISTEDAKGPGDYAEEALRKVSLAQRDPGKIAVHHINTSDGSVATEQLTPQEFIDGKAKRT